MPTIDVLDGSGSLVSLMGGKSIKVTLTVTNGAYTAGDVVGGLITLADAARINGGHAVINSIKLAGVVDNPYELWFFNEDIATPAADNAVFNLAAADGNKFLGAVPIAASHYCAAANSFKNATVPGVGLEVKAAVGNPDIYAYLKAVSTTSPGTTTMYLTVDIEYLD